MGYITGAELERAKKVSTSKSVGGPAIKGGVKLRPPDSLKPFKLVHRRVEAQAGGGDSSEPDSKVDGSFQVSQVMTYLIVSILHEQPALFCYVQVKVEPDVDGTNSSDIRLSELRLFDDNDGQSTSGPCETLFFVMPNTSGLVAGCTVSESSPCFLLVLSCVFPFHSKLSAAILTD